MVDILRADYRSLKPACDALLDGKVIAFPTETVYGLGVLHGSDSGIELLRKIKGREQEKPFQILIPTVAYAEKYAQCTDSGAQALMNTFWPGPLTLILPDHNGGTSGLRIPNNKWLRVLMLELKCALIATSANFATETPANSVTEISEKLKSELALIIDDGKSEIGQGSTVAGISDKGEIEVFRHGSITAEELNKVYKSE